MPNQMQLKLAFNDIDVKNSSEIPLVQAFSSNEMPKTTPKQRAKTTTILKLNPKINFDEFVLLNYFLINAELKDQTRMCFITEDRKCTGFVNQEQLIKIIHAMGFEVPTEAVAQICEKCVGGNQKMGLEVVQNILQEIEKQACK
ncbi:EF-hand_domain pair-containing protein [Hexamita inflata]|uniref:EF-hand domain pair-containing protein n=1 Tax=Hexamita inflata TaxID=28002 RepID=A0AA86PN69_9EUKA|nr:EF-hand domain pair-containing protein [Hexamita inflata]